MPKKDVKRPDGERIELRVSPELKKRLVAHAERENATLGEMVVKLVCRQLQEPDEFGLLPRKAPGRKPKAAPAITLAPWEEPNPEDS